MRSEASNVLVLDCGDFIARQDRPSEKNSIQLKIATEFLLSGMDWMGYSAANVGEGEVVFGDAFLAGMASRVRFPVLSASVLQGPARPFPEVAVATIGGMQVGIAGILWDGFSAYAADHSDPGRPLALLGTRDALARCLELLAGKVDLKILLAHVPDQELLALLEEVPGFDIVIAGHDSDQIFIAEPRTVAGARLVELGWDGKTIGRIDLALEQDGTLLDVRGSYEVLDAKWPSHPEMAALHEEYLARVAEAIDEILQEYPVRPPASGGRYAGAAACRPCHELEWTRWSQTKHALATQTLVDRHRDYDPECFSCHTTGFQYEGGFRLISTTPEMGAVQCEGCHGAGAEHCAETSVPMPSSVPGESTCRTCHQPLHSPEFDFGTYKPQIQHLTK